MKNKFVLLLVLILMLTMAGCAGTFGTAFEIYAQSYEAMKEAESISMNTKIVMEIDTGAGKTSVSMTGFIKQIIRSETDIDMEMDMNTNVIGMDVSAKAYYKDGMYYTDMGGQKTKMSMSIEEAVKQANANGFDFPESSIKEHEVKNIAGGKELSFTLDGSALKSLLSEQLGSLNESLGTDSSMDFGDVQLKVVVNNDNQLKTVNMNISYEMDISGQKMKADCSILMDNIQFGGVTIDFPDDLDTYELQ